MDSKNFSKKPSMCVQEESRPYGRLSLATGLLALDGLILHIILRAGDDAVADTEHDLVHLSRSNDLDGLRAAHTGGRLDSKPHIMRDNFLPDFFAEHRGDDFLHSFLQIGVADGSACLGIGRLEVNVLRSFLELLGIKEFSL